MNPGPDANGGNGNGVRDFSGQTFGDALQNNRKRAGVFQNFGVFQNLSGGIFFLSLNLISAQLVYGLRGQTQMRHHRYA